MRRALFWLVALLAVPALLLLAGAAAAWWLVATESGLQWAVREAVERSGGRLQASGVQGSLLRSFRIARLDANTEAASVSAEELAGSVDLFALSTGMLRVSGLDAARIELRLETQEKKDEPPPARLSLPLEVHIDDAHVGRLEVRRGDALHPVTDLRFTYRGDAGGHLLAPISAQTEWGHVTLEATMAATPPFRVEARGDLRRPEAAVQAYVRALPFATEKLEALQVTAEEVDLARFVPALPRTRLTFSLQGEATRDALFAGVLRAANALAGPLDRERLPVVALDTRLALRGEALHLEAIDAVAAGGAVSGSGVLRREKSTFKLDLRGIDLRALRSNLRATALSGAIEVGATPKAQTLRGTLSQDDLSLSVDAARAGDSVQVHSFEAHARGGLATGSGSVRLGAPLRFAAQLAFKGFDPKAFGDYPEGSLNGNAEVSGALGEPLRAQARWTIVDSTLAGRALATEGHGELIGERVQGLQAQAAWGDNRATARGALGAGGDTLQWTLEAPDLPQTFIQGRIEASGSARGSWRDPQVSFEARAAPAVIAGRMPVASLSARGEGTLARHEARLAADGEGFDAHALLRGGWSSGAGWRGMLEELRNAGRYPLALEAPVALAFSPEVIEMGALRARLGAGYLRVQTLKWREGRLATRGEFEGLPARWPLAAAGLLEHVRASLLLDGRWDLATRPGEVAALEGSAELRRASGDLELLQPTPLALGLRDATLAVRVDNGLVSAGLDLDAELAAVQAQLRAGRGGEALHGGSPVELTARARVADIRTLAGTLPPALRVAGRAQATVLGRGTLGAPEFAGSLSADALSVHVPPYGIFLDDGVLRATLKGDALEIERFSLRGGKGTFTAKGHLPLRKGGAAELRWNASRLVALDRPDMRLVVSGKGTAGFENQRLGLRGELQVQNGYIERGFDQLPTLASDIEVVGGPLATGTQEKPAPRRRPPLDVELVIDLGENFKVRQAGFDGLLKGEVVVSTSGRDGELRAYGRIEAADATFRAYGRTLNVDPGAVLFNGPLDNPSLQIEAWRRNQEVAAGVRVTGTLEQPRVELISDPPLPEGARLSWLVLGRPPAEATGGDLALLQTAASALIGRGDSVPLTTRIADAVGLDEVSLRGSAELENRVVAVGKRLSDRIYVSYEQGVGAVAQNLVKIDLALTDRISLRGQTGTISGAGLYYRYSWD